MMVSIPERHELIYIWKPKYILFILAPTFLVLLLNVIVQSSGTMFTYEDDDEYEVSMYLVLALDAQESIAEWLDELSQASPQGREWPIRRLGIRRGLCGEHAQSVRAALEHELNHPSEDVVAATAAASLVRFGHFPDELVPTLTRLLRSQNPKVRASAAQLLARIGPRAKAAIPALKTAARDSNWMVHFLSNQALMNIGPPNEEIDIHLEEVAHDLQKGSLAGRLRAAFALGRMGRAGVPMLREALLDQHPAVRQIAVRSLGVIGADAADAAHRLVAMLRNRGEVDDVRRIIPRALCAVAPDDPAVFRAIIAASRLPQESPVEWAATNALWTLFPPTVRAQSGGQYLSQTQLSSSEPEAEETRSPPLASALTADYTASRPTSERDPRCSGVLVMRARIDARGRVAEVEWLRRLDCASPWSEIEDAYAEAVRQERYWPIMLDGKPQPMIVTISVNIRLS